MYVVYFFFATITNHLMSVPLGNRFCFASNLNVCLEFVLDPRKALKLSEKANQIFPSGADIKCIMCNTYYPHYSTVDMCRCIHFVLEMVWMQWYQLGSLFKMQHFIFNIALSGNNYKCMGKKHMFWKIFKLYLILNTVCTILSRAWNEAQNVSFINENFVPLIIQ